MGQTKRYIGVDPGSSGAFAVLDEAGKLLRFGNAKAKENYGLDDFQDALREAAAFGPTVCAVERILAFPGIPAQDLIGLGTSSGVLLGAAFVLGASVLTPTSSQWKKAMGVPKDKPLSKARALAEFPTLPPRVRHDVAEACLIALWAFTKQGLEQ